MQAERVVYQTKLHWILFVRPILLLILAVLSLSEVPELGMIILLIAAIDGLVRLVTYASSEFALTTRRVIVKVGFIQRNISRNNAG